MSLGMATLTGLLAISVKANIFSLLLQSLPKALQQNCTVFLPKRELITARIVTVSILS
jgi:hypothetical protein